MGADPPDIPNQGNELLLSCVGQFFVVCSVCCWVSLLILHAWSKVMTADPPCKGGTHFCKTVRHS